MAIPRATEAMIIYYRRAEKRSVSAIARKVCVSRTAVQRVLGQSGLLSGAPSNRTSEYDAHLDYISASLEKFPTIFASKLYQLVRERGYRGGLSHFRHLLAARRPKFDAAEWMRALLFKQISFDDIGHYCGEFIDTNAVLDKLYNGRLSERKKALFILSARHGLTDRVICQFAGMSTNTASEYRQRLAAGGFDAIFSRKSRALKSDDEQVKKAIFSVIHHPPSSYDINRTTWTMSLLVKTLRDIGQPACPDVIRAVTKAAGYRWRKARVALTSNDPDYAEKLAKIRSILSGLRPDEAFFSVDEYGPFAVKMRGGRALVGRNDQRIVPQRQKSRGTVIITAALELATNQVTHFYSSKKNTTEMIKMATMIAKEYRGMKKLYLSWDVASWHISKELGNWIERHNARARAARTARIPIIETAPLPASAQFLNVIESIFSGMSRAIIHNSDYASVQAAKVAIDRYFTERNSYFREHPQRAGKKIWGKEREPAVFSESGNCKDPRYR
jgi:transposase